MSSTTRTPRHRSARSAPALAVLASVALVTGCSSSSGGSGKSSTSAASSSSTSSSAALTGSITVFAAASLTGTFTQLGTDFQSEHPATTVKFSFGASSALAQQIVAGAPADVFASAATKDMDTVTGAGDAADPTTFATNSAEIAVSPSATSTVKSITDLPNAKVALCQPQVPCGALAQTVLNTAGVKVTPVTQGLDVKSTLAYVTSGEADAAIVYVTDVKAAGTSVTGVKIPAADNSTTSYPIATTKNTQDGALAKAFEAYVLSKHGQAVLAGAGFAKP